MQASFGRPRQDCCTKAYNDNRLVPVHVVGWDLWLGPSGLVQRPSKIQ